MVPHRKRPEKEPEAGGGSTSKILTALLTPLTVAIVGFFTTSYLNERQTADTNARVYADLLSRREEADTSLRKEMFNTVLQRFLENEKSQADRILKLELLAYNFHESLDLAPLFLDVVRRVNPSTPEGAKDLDRLVKVAREVNAKQVESLLTDVGAGARGQVDFSDLSKHLEGIRVIDSKLQLNLPPMSGSQQRLPRRFIVEVLDRRPDTRELRVRLIVSKPGRADADLPAEVDVPFWLGAFDFPGIDNTRLSEGERCAVVLSVVDENSAQIQLVYFPATRASLRDKLFVEEVMDELLHLRKQNQERGGAAGNKRAGF